MGRTQGILDRFPHFYLSEDARSLFYQFVQVFGETLDEVEADLLRVMYAHYVDKADNEGSQGFNTNQKGDLDKIFSLYLENLGGTSQLKQVNRPSGQEGIESDKIYRQRIRGLINVLKSGASTKQGIIDIVAANLGIVGEDEAAIAARNQIRIFEFLPEPQTNTWNDLHLLQEFVVENPNVVKTYPEIRLRIGAISQLPLPLTKPRIVNLTTGEFVQYNGTVNKGDLLSFFPNKTASLNGIPIPVVGGTPALWLGESHWRFEALIGQPEARFDRTLFDFSLFQAESLTSPDDEQAAAFAIDITMTVSKLTPGSFMVRIPWDIPGFTENLDQFGDRPREQIKYIVDKVKAAGVFAVIAYEKRFDQETHELADSLRGSAQRQPLPEDHVIEEANFDIGSIQTPYAGGIVHELSDSLTTSGVFDYTQFDSLNTFA